MKSKLLLTVIAATLLWMCSTPSAKAQTNPNHVYHMHTWYMVTSLDSIARSEGATILKEYFTKVTMKNEYVIHQWSMVHFFTEDSREFVTITEFANWNDIAKAGDRDVELERQAWPDAQKRQDFMKKMDSYFTYHKDAIYNSLSDLTK
jgi:hypothetical protein